MGLKILPRPGLRLAKPQCTFKPLFPAFVTPRTLIIPSGQAPPPSTSSPNTSSSSSSTSAASSKIPPPRRTGPPNTMSDFQRPVFTPDRHDLLSKVHEYKPRRGPSAAELARSQAEIERMNLNAAIEKQNTRRWKAGDVYAPHDLSSVEMRKWKSRRMANRDVFEALDLDPRGEYKNYSMMWEFVSRMGRIKHPRETGLGNVNQRRLAKAVRRSIGMGLMPSVHKHPEMLEAEAIAQARMMARSPGQQRGVGSFG